MKRLSFLRRLGLLLALLSAGGVSVLRAQTVTTPDAANTSFHPITVNSAGQIGGQRTTARNSAGSLLINPVPQSLVLGRRLTIEVGSRGPVTLEPLVVRSRQNQLAATQPADANALIEGQQAQTIANAGAGAARKYFVTDLGTLGGTQSFAVSINDLGQVFGTSSITGDTTGHAFFYRDGTMFDLGPLAVTLAGGAINSSGQIATAVVIDGVVTPAIYESRTDAVTVIPSLGGVSSFGLSGAAASVNNVGEAVGYSYADAVTSHAFLYYNGGTTDIGSFGSTSAATAINDAGTIVGYSSNQLTSNIHAFVYSQGVMIDIDPSGDSTFGTSLSAATDINNRGQVVGYFSNQSEGTIHAYIYDGGSFTDIGSPGSPETDASAINDHSQVVGVSLVLDERVCPGGGSEESCFNSYKMHAFLYAAEKMTDLNVLIPLNSGWELSWAFDINNDGQIVGYGVLNDNFRAFLLTPATSKKQCKKGGWKKFGFRNRGECIQFLKAGK